MMRRSLFATLAALSLAHAASGQDLFQYSLTPTGGGGPAPLSASGSSLWELTQQVIETRGDFSGFSGVAFDSSLRYAGVDNAISISINAAGDSATLEFTALGSEARVFTFSGANISNQIEDFLKDGADGQLGAFMREMAKRSLVFPVDGNPSATTARASRYRYNRFGLMDDLRPRHDPVVRRGTVESQIPRTGDDGARPQSVRVIDSVDTGTSTLRFDFSAGTIDTDVGDGSDFRFAISNEYRFGERVALVLGVPFSYHKIESSEVYNVAGHVDLPITFVRRTEMDGWTWKVTPGIVVAGSGSTDFLAGGLLWGAGVTSLIGYDLGPWSFSFISQFDTYESVELKYDSYEFDPDISQDILTNGVRVAYALDDSWYLYGGLSYTDFLEDAAVDNYWSPAAGARFRTRHGWDVNIGYEGDIGDGYDAHRLTGGVQWTF